MDEIVRRIEELKRQQAGLGHVLATLAKTIMIFSSTTSCTRASVDKVLLPGSEAAYLLAQSPQDRGNPQDPCLYLCANRYRSVKKHPLLVFVHGGLLANFNTVPLISCRNLWLRP